MIDKRYTINTGATNEIEALLTRFERDRGAGLVDLHDYLAPQDDPAYAAVVTEVARIDLEHEFEAGRNRRASKYIALFPGIFQDDRRRTQLVFEEYRLRRWAGEDVEAVHIAQPYGVDGSQWPLLKLGSGEAPKTHPTTRRFSKAELATRVVHYPRVGETFAGYPLIERLGEGVFSRVSLARQPDLASRHVVVKVTPLSTDESDRLARLQHSNIIPIYSVHRDGELFCICMPFLGATTLADLSPSGERWASLDGPAQELVSTILERRQSTLRFVTESQRDASSDHVMSAEPSSVVTSIEPNPRKDEPIGLAPFARVGYVEALVSLVTGAVEGLVHAHQHGIIHRDLKPANVLVSDDGNPVLLDFNLAVFSHEPEIQVVGGTLPYRSPQQLTALETREAADASDDVFSMGVILYELLSGHQPFKSPAAGEAFELADVISNRRTPATPIRSRNRRVTPGLQAIIDKCLAPARRDRYENATQLLEDLKRHRQHLPLRYAPDHSVVERVSKWASRHPRITSASSVALMAALFLLVCALLIYGRGQRIATMDAQAKAQKLAMELPRAITALSTLGHEPEVLTEGLQHASRMMEFWFVGNDWNPESGANRLDDASRQGLRRQLAKLAYLMADAEADLYHRRDRDAPAQSTRRQQAFRWNQLAGDLDDRLLPLVESQSERLAAKFQGRAVRPMMSKGLAWAHGQMRLPRSMSASRFNHDRWRRFFIEVFVIGRMGTAKQPVMTFRPVWGSSRR